MSSGDFCHYCRRPNTSCECPDTTPFEFSLNKGEVKALARILVKQYIAYDDYEAHDVVNKIFRKIDDMDSRTSQTGE